MTPKEQQLWIALKTLLDSVDYERGACHCTEMVGAVLPKEVLNMARIASGDKQPMRERGVPLEKPKGGDV